jgi:hypothetical protein
MALLRLEMVLLVLGLILTGVSAAARIQGQISANLAIQNFEAAPLESTQNIEAPAPAPVPVAAAVPPPAPRPAPAEAPPTQLPKTASPLPLVGLLGLALCGASLGLRAMRRR